MRAFVRLRRLIVDSTELGRRMAELEQRYEDHDEQLRAVFQAHPRVDGAPRADRQADRLQALIEQVQAAALRPGPRALAVAR